MDDTVAVSQMEEFEPNENRHIFLTDEQCGQKDLYQNIINKFSLLPMQQKVLLEPEQIDQMIELLPYLQYKKEHGNSEQREIESILMLLDYIGRKHTRITSNDLVKQKMVELI